MKYHTQSLEHWGHTYRNAHVRCRWEGWQASRAALSAETVHAPKGWKLVPEEPTREMIWSCKDRFIPRIALPVFVAAYKTMLAAAPQPAAQERRPFTDEERLRIFEKHFSHDMRQGEFFDEIFIIAEREHGITGEPK